MGARRSSSSCSRAARSSCRSWASAYFAMGLVRNRVFANTYGAGPELDAYNAAFRIPEIALDVLVASGLTAPFVPIFTTIRRTERGRREHVRADRADRRRRGHGGRLDAHRARGAVAGRRLRGVRPGDALDVHRAAAHQLPRPDPVRRVVRDRRGPRREPALRLLRAGAGPVHDRDRARDRAVRRPVRDLRDGVGRGRRRGAPISGSGRSGTRRTSFRIRPAFAIRTRGVRGVHPADGAADDQPPDRADHLDLLHDPGCLARGGQRDGAELRDRLPGPAGQPDRRDVLARGLPDPVGGLRRRRRGDVSRRAAAQPAHDRAADGDRRDRPVRPVRGPRGRPAGRRQVRPRRRRAHVGGRGRVRDLGPVRRPRLPALEGLYATHDTIRQVVSSFAGLGVVVAVSQVLVEPVGILAIPLGYAAGMASKDALLAIFLVGRLRRFGRLSDPAR